MRTKLFFLISAVMIMAGNSYGQTYGRGALNNDGNCTATGTGGGCSTTLIGSAAGANNTGTNNTFVGSNAGWSNNIGENNTYSGTDAGYYTDGSQNTIMGYQAGGKGSASANSFSFNSFFGVHAGFNHKTTSENVGIGYRALYTQNYSASAINTYNVAVGNNALNTNNPTSSSNGWKNTAIGHNSGYSNSTGSYNLFQGFESGYSNTTGGNNVFSGFEAGYYNQTGSNNTISGYQAGGKGAGAVNSFSNNSFFGYQAGYSNTTGGNNTFNGYQAGNANTTAGNNTFIGYQAGNSNTVTTDNTAIGYQALFTQSYSTTSIGSFNTAVGNKALYKNDPAGGETGRYNTAIGNQTLEFNTTGYYNSALGHGALRSNTTGFFNTAVGNGAADAFTASSHTTAVGGNALTTLISGNKNTAIGYAALRYDDYGENNTAVGVEALLNCSTATGDNNTAVGYAAGGTITSGSGNTFLGQGADAAAACSTCTNMTAIGYGAVVTSSNDVYIGNGTIDGVYSHNGVFTTSDGRFKFNVQENVKGLEFIKKLRPVTYQMNTQTLTEHITQNMPDSIRNEYLINVDFSKSKNIVHSGLIAQEVEQAALDCGFTSYIISTPENDNAPYAINYSEMVVPLIKAIQEQQNTIDSILTVLNIGKSERKLNNGGDNEEHEQIKSENSIQIELASRKDIILYQNEPNPFSNTTVIRYFVPESITDAYIVFYDEFGKELKKVELTEKGFGRIEATTMQLASGIYTYSIVTDGKVIDTKKMMRIK